MLDMGTVRGLITLLTLVSFLGICWWAYRPGNRSRFEEDGWMPFDHDEIPDTAETDATLHGEDSV